MSETAVFDVAAGTRRVVRRWWLLVIFLIIGGLGGWLFHHQTNPKYTATASIVLSAADSSAILGNTFSVGDQARFAATQAAIVASSAVKDRVENVEGHSVPAAVASEQPDVDIIDVSVTDTDRSAVARIANEYVDAYLAVAQQQTQSQLIPLQRHLTSEAAVLANRLARLRTNGGGATSTAFTTTSDQLQQVESQLVQVKGALRLGAVGPSRLASATTPTAPSSQSLSTQVIEGALIGLLVGLILALAIPQRKAKSIQPFIEDRTTSNEPQRLQAR